jgi:hypothetical protein
VWLRELKIGVMVNKGRELSSSKVVGEIRLESGRYLGNVSIGECGAGC